MIADRNDSRGRNADRGNIGEKDQKMGKRWRGERKNTRGSRKSLGNCRKTRQSQWRQEDTVTTTDLLTGLQR